MRYRHILDDMAPKGPEVTIGDYTTTHFYMCGSAIKTAEKHADKPGMEKLIRLQDMVYQLEKTVMDVGKSSEEANEFANKLHDAIMDQAKEIGIEDEVGEYQKMHLDSIVKGDPEPGFGRVDIEESDFKPHYMYKGTKNDYKAKRETSKKKHDALMKRGYNHDDPETKKVEEEITLEDNQDFNEEFGDLGFSIDENDMFEAKYQGRTVKLNKPMAGDVKKFKVYVKNKKGNVIKVNFGQKGMKIKKNNPARRRSFRARHNCDNPGPKTKARYWSCRKW